MSDSAPRRLALYPGTFDPFTLGHLDILERALVLFDEVEVTVGVNAGKRPLFTPEERCAMIRESTAHLQRVTVASFEGLLAEHAQARGAVALVRGLRQVRDFDYELPIALANRKLYPEVETVMLPTAAEYAHISATIVRDVHRWGGDVAKFVPPPVVEALKGKKK